MVVIAVVVVAVATGVAVVVVDTAKVDACSRQRNGC